MQLHIFNAAMHKCPVIFLCCTVGDFKVLKNYSFIFFNIGKAFSRTATYSVCGKKIQHILKWNEKSYK